MNGNKQEKKAARDRQERTGESYSTALAHVRAQQGTVSSARGNIVVRVSPVLGDDSVIAYVFAVVAPATVLTCLEGAQQRLPGSVVAGAEFNFLHEDDSEGMRLSQPGVSGFLRFVAPSSPDQLSRAAEVVAAEFRRAGFDASVAEVPFVSHWLVASPAKILAHYIATNRAA